MALTKGGLFSEYILATNTINWYTFGAKCKWDNTSQRVKFIRKPCTIAALMVLVLGMPQLADTVRMILSKGNKADTTSFGNSSEIRQERVTVAVMMTYGYIGGYAAILAYLLHYDQLETFFNQFISLEQAYWKESDLQSLEKRKIILTKWMIRLLRLAGIHNTGFAVGAMAVILPNLALNIFSFPPGTWIMDVVQCLTGSLSPGKFDVLLENIVIFFGNSRVWALNIKFGLLAGIEMILGPLCLTVALIRFKRMARDISYNNMAGGVAKALLFRCCLFYRQIQIIARIYNNIYSTLLAVMLICFGATQMTTSLELFCRLGSSGENRSLSITESAISSFYLIVLFMCTMCKNFLFGSCAEVHETSTQILKEMKYRRTGREPKVYEKMRRSLGIIRVKFGSTNFIEKLTPVIFQMFVIQRIADILLIRYKGK